MYRHRSTKDSCIAGYGNIREQVNVEMLVNEGPSRPAAHPRSWMKSPGCRYHRAAIRQGNEREARSRSQRRANEQRDAGGNGSPTDQMMATSRMHQPLTYNSWIDRVTRVEDKRKQGQYLPQMISFVPIVVDIGVHRDRAQGSPRHR